MTEDKGKIFIPKSIDGSSSNGRYISEVRLAVGLFSLVLVIVLTIVFFILTKSKFFTFIFVVLELYPVQLIFRFVVMKEKEIVSLFRDQKENSVTTLGSIWGINHISENGYIRYTNGVVAHVIELKYLSKECCTSESLLHSQMCRANAMQLLGSLGYSIKQYYIHSSAVDYKNIDIVDKFKTGYSTKQLRDYAVSMQKYNRNRLKLHANLEREFWLVSTSNADAGKDLNKVLKSLGRLYLTDHVFSPPVICDLKGVQDFIKEYHSINFFDYEELVSKVKVVYKRGDKRVATVRVAENSLMQGLGIELLYDCDAEEAKNKDDKVKKDYLEGLSDEEIDLINMF